MTTNPQMFSPVSPGPEIQKEEIHNVHMSTASVRLQTQQITPYLQTKAIHDDIHRHKNGRPTANPKVSLGLPIPKLFTNPGIEDRQSL